MKKVLCFILATVIFFACNQNVEDGEGKKSKDTSLKQLVVSQVGEKAISFTSPVAKILKINLHKKVSVAAFTITATPKEEGVTVFFDNDKNDSKTKLYGAFQQRIKIMLKAENSEPTIYILDIKEPSVPSQDDATLKILVIKQGGKVLQNLQSNVAESIDVNLTKKVSATDKLRIEATPNDANAKVYFNSVLETSKIKEYSTFIPKVIIKVEKGTATKTYTLNITEPSMPSQDDATLKTLVIKQGGELLQNLQSSVAESIDVNLTKKVSATDKLRIEATPNDVNAKVYFNSMLETSKTKEYLTFIPKVIIKVEKGAAIKTYTLNITEPIPIDYNLKCNVVDSIGGSNVEGVTVKIYLADSMTKKGEGITNADGNVYFVLDDNKAYDFILSKKGRAASRVENVYLASNEKKFLPIVIREGSIGAKAIAPEINKINLIYKKDSQWKFDKVVNNFEIDCSKLTDSHCFYVTTISKSGEVIPEKFPSWNNNKGFGMNIGSPFRHDIGYAMTWPIRYTNSQGETITRDAQGVVSQDFGFSIGSISALDGEITLYFIAYDQAGNRCERQERVIVSNGKLKAETDPNHSFSEFSASSERYYSSLETFSLGSVNPFGMSSEDETPTSLNVTFNFKFNNRINIYRVDIMRRNYQEGDITKGWERVYTRQYEEGFKGNNGGGYTLYDDSGSLEEGKTYQYKLEAYSKDGKITSNVATIRIMEAFNLLLISPAPRVIIDKADIQNQDFSFRISNPSLWDRQKADYCSFGILVIKDEYAEYEDSTNTTRYYGLCFAAKLKYDFNKTGNEAFLIAGATKRYDVYDYKVFNTLSGSSGFSLKDVFKYENGNVTLKKNFFSNPSFNTFSNEALVDSIDAGGIYYWDVPNMAQCLLKEQYDRGVAFVKEYPYLDPITGNEVLDGRKSKSSSYSNRTRASGAINGRALFIVK